MTSRTRVGATALGWIPALPPLRASTASDGALLDGAGEAKFGGSPGHRRKQNCVGRLQIEGGEKFAGGNHDWAQQRRVAGCHGGAWLGTSVALLHGCDGRRNREKMGTGENVRQEDKVDFERLRVTQVGHVSS
jgi:hypothetical protein